PLAQSARARGRPRLDCLLQTYRPVRVPARLPARVLRAARGSAGAGRAPGAIARARERAFHTGSRNRVRVPGCGYAGRPGSGVSIIRSFLGEHQTKWLNTSL